MSGHNHDLQFISAFFKKFQLSPEIENCFKNLQTEQRLYAAILLGNLETSSYSKKINIDNELINLVLVNQRYHKELGVLFILLRNAHQLDYAICIKLLENAKFLKDVLKNIHGRESITVNEVNKILEISKQRYQEKVALSFSIHHLFAGTQRAAILQSVFLNLDPFLEEKTNSNQLN